MTVLSNVDIERELGDRILIYPFSKSNLRGASYNLTASRLAWNLKDGKSLYDASTGKVVIPPQSTALIETNESIWVSSEIAGTYHSKVKLVSKGISHIGTTLDPEYIGSSLITVHNHSDEPIDLNAEKDTFVSLIFHYVETKETIRAGNVPSRPDMLNRFSLTPEDDQWLDEEFRKDPDSLREKLYGSQDFQEIISRKQAENERIKSAIDSINSKRKRHIVFFVLISAFVVVVILNNYLSSNKASLSGEPWYDLAVNIIYAIMLGVPGSLLIKILSDI
jgi:deoxycytidine triphosphate deaminase